jgi:predicted nucleic acid-binding Zn ribbon protein
MGGRTGQKSRPEHIGTILKGLLRHKGLDESIHAHRAVVYWDSLVGEEVSRHAKAVQVERGRLIVDVENSIWMHQLQMQESELRQRINQQLSGEPILQIRFRLGRTPLEEGDASTVTKEADE